MGLYIPSFLKSREGVLHRPVELEHPFSASGIPVPQKEISPFRSTYGTRYILLGELATRLRWPMKLLRPVLLLVLLMLFCGPVLPSLPSLQLWAQSTANQVPSVHPVLTRDSNAAQHWPADISTRVVFFTALTAFLHISVIILCCFGLGIDHPWAWYRESSMRAQATRIST